MKAMSQRDVINAATTCEVLVVGSGFFGLTIAERAATELDASVVVLERRSHIGGNAFSYRDDETGIEVHKYGSHLFHTSSEQVWEYVNRFTAFNDYRHHVYTQVAGRTYTMPINLLTMSAFFDKSFSPHQARKIIGARASGEVARSATNLRDRAIGLVGRELYEAFIEGYTWKQWQTDPAELPPDIINRLPVRFDLNTRYFSDTYEGLPLDGYHEWIGRMAAHPRIRVFSDVDFLSIAAEVRNHPLIVFTGPIDAFFGFSEGELSWRTLDFETEILPVQDFQGTSVMNYGDRDVPFTRIHEPKHLHPERDVFSCDRTVIMREYSRFAGRADEPYYPVGSTEDRRRLQAYRERAEALPNVIFGGRLGSYQYLDMHMAIASALQIHRNRVRPMLEHQRQAPR